MKNGALVLIGLLANGLPAAAQNGVFKCTSAEGAIVYQGAPCRAQQSQVTLVEPRKWAEAVAATDPNPTTGPAAPEVERRSMSVGEELIPGMSDTKVLNMRGWGRPQHIARSRAEDGYREEWTYVSRSDGATRLVSFVNGKVAGVRSQSEVQVARATARQETQQLADQTRREVEAWQMAQTAARTARATEQRSVARDEPKAASTPADGQPSVGVMSIERSVNNPPAVEANTPAEPQIDHAARAAAAIARIEGSRREPLPAIRLEPPIRPEPPLPSMEPPLQPSEPRLPIAAIVGPNVQ